jgi:hypothetical protein
VNSLEARHAQWLHKRRPGYRQTLAHKPAHGIHV